MYHRDLSFCLVRTGILSVHKDTGRVSSKDDDAIPGLEMEKVFKKNRGELLTHEPPFFRLSNL